MHPLTARIEETQVQQQPQPSTSYHPGRPPQPPPQFRPSERLPDFDEEAGSTWIFPVNYPLRGYQYSMVESSLFRNTLISLPTGLGKTFIAAVVMYNFYRWYPTCKVVFMAPTKPLVCQQIEACFNIMGIPQEDISQMTGTLNPEKRMEQWATKRVFFLTPQVVTNDLSRGSCPAKLIKCLVLDEAHRALGNHAYCQVVRGLKEHGHDFRILALSATPGSDLMAVKQVLNNLCISHVELRSEDSPDIQDYTFQRSIEKVVVPFGEELTSFKNRYLKVLRVYVGRLLDLNVLHTRDETTLTKFQLLKSRECFRQNPPNNLPRYRFGVVEGLFALCMTLYHSYELMLQHGTRSFYRFLKETLSGGKSNYFARRELCNNEIFQSIMNDLSKKFEADGVMSPSKQDQSGLFSLVGSPQPKNGAGTSKGPFVISHPKMAKLLEVVLEHHQKFAREGKSTRIMIFSQYRDSVMEITEMLQQHHPTVKAMSFIGHSTKAQKGRGFSQKKQLEVVRKFRGGGYNTLVSTCVGEEGLDIGDVDLIVCYDAPKSPIRLVQRMGRTGRQREGRIVVLVTKGKEEESYNASQYQKKAINNALANTSKLARYLSPSSPRMVPSGLSPTCLKLHMKVDAWKTNTKGGRSTPKGRGSILSMISRTNSATSKAGQGVPLMSQDDWQWYRNNKVAQQDIKTLPPPSLMCLDASNYTFDSKRHINLGSYQPWQSLPQMTHLVGHSPLTLHLVELTEFIGLQQHIGADEDPYGLEMAAFLNMAYVEDDEEVHQLSPDFKRVNDRQNQEDKKEKKGKRKQNAVTNKRKKAKVVQSSLITAMFSRMTQSQAKDREDNQPKGMEHFEDATRRLVVGSSQSSVKSSAVNANIVHMRDDDVNSADDDDDVICLMDDNVNLAQNTPGSSAGSQNDRHKFLGKTEPSKSNRLNENHTRIIKDERQGDIEGELFFPIPSGNALSIDILVPPPKIDDDDNKEIEEPDSPSEVLEFCNKWVTRNLKKTPTVRQKVNALYCSKDIFESFITEEVSGAKSASTSKHTNNTACKLIDDNDNYEQQLETSLLSIGEVSPVIGKFQCTKNKVMINTNDNGNKIFGTSGDAADLIELDTSPIVGRNSTLHCASTPKVVSKCLFKKFTPGLSTVGEFSPIPWKDTNASPSSVGHSSVRGDKGQQDTPKQAAPHLDHRNRFKSKLSRFAKPEVPELESIAEILSVDKSKVSNGISVVEESGKKSQKKLYHDAGDGEEEITVEFNKPEIQKSNLNEKFSEIKNVESLQNMVSECKNDSSFLFEDLNMINLSKDSGNQIAEEKNKEDMACMSRSNISNSVRDLPQSSQKLREENVIKGQMNTTNTQHGERSQHGVVQGAKVKSAKDSNKYHEAAVSNSPDLMEDCSLFERIAECDVEPATARSSVAENLDNSSYGLSVTQVLNFMNEKSDCSTQHASTSNIFPKPSPIHSQKVQMNKMQSVGHLASKSNLSLSRSSHHESEATSYKCEVPGTSTSSQVRDGPRLSLSRTLPKLPGKSNHAIEQKTQHQHVREKHIFFCAQENEEFEEMSESLLADIDLKLVEIPRSVNDVQSENVSGSKNSSTILYPMPVTNEDQVNRTHEGSKNLSTTRFFSNGTQDDTRESNKFMSPTQADIRESSRFMSLTQPEKKENSRFMSPTQDETQLLITRKRKAYHVVGSDQEDSLLSSDSEKNVSKASTTSGSSKTSTVSTCVTAPLRKAVANKMRNQFDDEDDDFVEVLGLPQPKQQKVKSFTKKKKRKKLEYLDDEAEISLDTKGISSDESSEEEKEYDRSFMDDRTYLSQDNAQDMRAVYLRSVVSPMQGKAQLNLPPPKYNYLYDSDASEGEEGEDSFVVDNSFVEYETEYIGDTMLAEDPIINQALQDQGNSKKTEDAATGNKAKRKRIIMNESTSEEDTENEQSPVKDQSLTGVGGTQPLHQVSEMSVRIQVRNTTVACNKNTPSCSRDGLGDEKGLEIIMEVNPFKSPSGPSKQSDEVVPVNSRSEQRFTNSSRPESTSSLVSKSSYVLPATNRSGSAVNVQQAPHGIGRNGGNQERANSGTGSGGGGPSKETTEKDSNENADISVISNIPPSPMSSMGGCQSLLPESPQLNKSSSSFFVSAEPHNSSFSFSQSSGSSTPQEAVGVLVDSSEVNSGGNVLSRLRLRYRAHTAVVQLTHAHYAVSTRMAVARLSLTVFSSTQHRSHLVERVQGMLELYERPVLIVEDEAARGSPAHQARSRYLDTIVCACTQVSALKVLYSKGQEETSHLLWQLLLQEKTKGFKISVVPTMTKKRQQMAKFYLTLPNISYPTAVALAQSFSTVREFITSSVECIQKKGKISLERATAVKQQLTRQFREDMLP
ncbi:Fanconi anemia group M protein-like isoform X2 [Scylla paramamosain]|uniref:Fanconi anemia group M protein-like isoform X2 n=1 Tax=Scylla paramamosain TaxID=85552 RepID=UPI003082E06B